jgi:anti-sigma factor RsiW
MLCTPQNTGEARPREATRNGYNIISWSHGEIAYWAVSDLNRQELREFVRDWRATPQASTVSSV